VEREPFFCPLVLLYRMMIIMIAILMIIMILMTVDIDEVNEGEREPFFCPLVLPYRMMLIMIAILMIVMILIKVVSGGVKWKGNISFVLFYSLQVICLLW
jgi:hypothetical protein